MPVSTSTTHLQDKGEIPDNSSSRKQVASKCLGSYSLEYRVSTQQTKDSAQSLTSLIVASAKENVQWRREGENSYRMALLKQREDR